MTNGNDRIKSAALAPATPERDDHESLSPAPELLALAQRLFWWKNPEEALRNPRRFLCQLMAIGTWDDVQIALRHWTKADFTDALEHASPGVFDARSWCYWHHRLLGQSAPPLPLRHLP